MRAMLFFTRSIMMAALLFLVGCVSDVPETRVVFQQIMVNGKKANLELDTGSPTFVLYPAGAKRLKLDYANLTEPAEIQAGGKSFTAPIPIFRLPWLYRLPFSPSEADGLVGWPEIRDNILIFDTERRLIRCTATLPPETKSWLRLKVLPNRFLLLQTPLEKGQLGAILVDTGAPPGVQLAPAQWVEWKKGHPETRLRDHRADAVSFGSFRMEVGWAANIELGALKLSDVAVENLPEGEAAFLRKEAPEADVVWALGMYALSRMNLIIDGPAGWAYLQPKSPPGPPYPGVDRPGFKKTRDDEGDWKVDESVSLASDNLHVVVGDDFWSKKDFASAAREYQIAVKLNSHNSEAWIDMGQVEALEEKTSAALESYNRAVTLNPHSAAAFAGRASAENLMGKFDGALADYNRALVLQPENSPYAYLFRYVLQRRLKVPVNQFAQTVAGWKESWTRDIAFYLSGDLDEKTLLRKAEKSDGEPAEGQRAEAQYYIGMTRLLAGDTAGARKAFMLCLATELPDYEEYQFARAELNRLAGLAAEKS